MIQNGSAAIDLESEKDNIMKTAFFISIAYIGSVL